MRTKWMLGVAGVLAMAGVLALTIPLTATTANPEETVIYWPEDGDDYTFNDPITVSADRNYCDYEENDRDVDCSLQLICPRVSPPDDEFCLDEDTVTVPAYMDWVGAMLSCTAPDGCGCFDEGDFCLLMTIDCLSDTVNVDVWDPCNPDPCNPFYMGGYCCPPGP